MVCMCVCVCVRVSLFLLSFFSTPEFLNIIAPLFFQTWLKVLTRTFSPRKFLHRFMSSILFFFFFFSLDLIIYKLLLKGGREELI